MEDFRKRLIYTQVQYIIAIIWNIIDYVDFLPWGIPGMIGLKLKMKLICQTIIKYRRMVSIHQPYTFLCHEILPLYWLSDATIFCLLYTSDAADE